MKIQPLLHIKNEQDIINLSSLIQDALITLKNINLLENNQCVIELNRFMWEEYNNTKDCLRINSFIHMYDFTKLICKKINKSDTKIFHQLLSCTIKRSNNHYELLIDTARDGKLVFFVDKINILLSDFGKPWKTKNIPKHI